MSLSVFDVDGNRHPIEYMALHDDEPVLSAACFNGMVLGLRGAPFEFRNDGEGPVFVRWMSAWHGERCIAVGRVDPARVVTPGDKVHVVWDGAARFPWQPVPLP